jgi:hypothetical protein
MYVLKFLVYSVSFESGASQGRIGNRKHPEICLSGFDSGRTEGALPSCATVHATSAVGGSTI